MLSVYLVDRLKRPDKFLVKFRETVYIKLKFV